MKTNKIRAGELAEEYFGYYQNWIQRPELKDKAMNIAEHDLVCKKLVVEFALEKLRAKIKEGKQETMAHYGELDEWEEHSSEQTRMDAEMQLHSEEEQ